MGKYSLNNQDLYIGFNANYLRDTLKKLEESLKSGKFDFNVTHKSVIGYDFIDNIISTLDDLNFPELDPIKNSSDDIDSLLEKITVNRKNFKHFISLVNDYAKEFKEIGLSDTDIALIKGDFTSFAGIINSKSYENMSLYQIANDFRFLKHSIAYYPKAALENKEKIQQTLKQKNYPVQYDDNNNDEIIYLINNKGEKAFNHKDAALQYNTIKSHTNADFLLIGDGQNDLLISAPAVNHFSASIKSKNYAKKLVIINSHGEKESMNSDNLVQSDNLLFEGLITSGNSKDPSSMLLLDACHSGAIFDSPSKLFALPYNYILSATSRDSTSSTSLINFSQIFEQYVHYDKMKIAQDKLINIQNDFEYINNQFDDHITDSKIIELTNHLRNINSKLSSIKLKEQKIGLDKIIPNIINIYALHAPQDNHPILKGETKSGIGYIIKISDFNKAFCPKSGLFTDCLTHFEEDPESFLISESNYFSTLTGEEFIKFGDLIS